LVTTVAYMGKPPKMRKGNGCVTEKATRPKGQKKKLRTVHAVTTQTVTANF